MPSPHRPERLRLQPLEARDNPATFAEAWYDPTHLTLSLAPDGTQVLGTANTLSSLLGALGPSATFQVLKAFQTWAVQANVNIGLVADSGAAFDESGALQGDPRYGDIRVGACALNYDVVALSTAAGNWTSSAGDILLNSLKTFSLTGVGTYTYDLYTVLLQEAGHALGLPNSTDPGSVMYEDYSRAMSGLSSGDVAAIRSLYGARTPDAYEGAAGNNTMATATWIAGPIEADLTSASGADWYRFVNPTGAATTVRLQAAGLSLLTARVEVYDAWGTRVGYAVTTDPLNNNLTVYVGASYPGAVFFIKVSPGRSDVFGIGAYRLTADFLGGFSASDPHALADGEVGANDLPGTATALAPAAGAGTYFAVSSLAAATDADYFRVTASGPYMTVAVAGVGGAGLAPAVGVYAADGTRLAAEVLSVSGNNLVLSVSGLTAGATYFVRVASATGAVGNYDVAVGFRAARPEGRGSYGALSPMAPGTAAALTVYQTQVVRLSLANAAPVGSDAQVRVRVYDSQNRLVFELAVGPGQSASRALLLRRGQYRLEVSATGTALAEVPYWLRVCGLTDPELASPLDPSADPVGGTDLLPSPPPAPAVTVDLNPLEPPPLGVTYY